MYVYNIPSTLWGEAQSWAETVLSHNCGLEGTLKWFGQSWQWPTAPSHRAGGNWRTHWQWQLQHQPHLHLHGLLSAEGLTLLAQLATYGCTHMHAHSSFEMNKLDIQVHSNVATHVCTARIYTVCSKYIWEDLSSDKTSFAWKGLLLNNGA